MISGQNIATFSSQKTNLVLVVDNVLLSNKFIHKVLNIKVQK